MGESVWAELGDKQLRYQGHEWALTGDVDVRERGDVLAVEARQTDDVRGRTATLSFRIRDPPDTLNPGNLGEHFDRLERPRTDPQLVVRKEGRTYRYDLQRIDYE